MARAIAEIGCMAALLCGAALARGQSVQFRIVQESAADSSALATALPHTPTATMQNYAVQARSIGGLGLAGFGFNIVIAGEPDSSGTLARLRIQNSNETYYAGVPTTSSAAGTHVGLANQYFAPAAANAIFNGLINTSGGSFTNTPSSQEIGSVGGYASGATMLQTPGMDPSGEGNPSTWALYGFGLTPTNGATAPLSSTLGPSYFAWGFLDIYRFRYTVNSAATSRQLTFTLTNPTAQTFSQFQYSGGVWGPIATTVPAGQISVTQMKVGVGTTGSCCAATGACSVEVAATCPAPSVWQTGQACSPNPCPQPGACCDGAGVCTNVLQSACTGVWTGGETCTTTYCTPLGVCCAGTACTILLAGQSCAGTWAPGPCTAEMCVRGACCQRTGCYFMLEFACASWTWAARAACAPDPCANPVYGVCCRSAQACQVTLQADCESPFAWSAWGACVNYNLVCNIFTTQGGTCCTLSGVCGVSGPEICSGNWIPDGVGGQCSGMTCTPPTGACCRGATCAVSTLGACDGAGNRFAGAGLACNASGGYPCCYADYNQVDDVSVQDIFDFLAGWFAADARTNINGGSIGVQDIFDFLSVWFAGCS